MFSATARTSRRGASCLLIRADWNRPGLKARPYGWIGRPMDPDLSLDFLRVVEQAAIACAHTMGQGDGKLSDHAAVEAMRRVMDSVPIDGRIVIGEGERDAAPMLYIGEKVGMAHSSRDRPS